MPAPPSFKPDKRSACLCGSGKLFKDCCAATYNKPRTLGASRDALSQGRYVLALKIARADITRYTIWHKSHTEPLLPTDNLHLLWILHIDIDALSELVDILMHCYRFANQWSHLPAVLDRLEPNIQDSRWQHKIIFYRALQAVGLEWDNREGTKRELERLPPIKKIHDVDILTFYLDIYSDELTLSERLDLADRVIDLTDDPGIAFSYRALKALFSMIIGQFQDAERQINFCIEELRAANLGQLSAFVENRLASALAIRASLHLQSTQTEDQAKRDLEEARYLFNKLLRECQFTTVGEAAIYTEIGDTYRFQGEWRTARTYYDRAASRYPGNAIYRILSAKCDIELGDIKQARLKLREVDSSELQPVEYVDYAFQCAALALRSRDEKDIESAKSYLDKCEPGWPYFREIRDRYKIALLSRDESRKSVGENRRTGVLSTILRYVSMSPGAFGVNIDINKIIEDAVARRASRQERRE